MVELPDDLARALYEALLRPELSIDRDGKPIYPINLQLASELRMFVAPKT